MSHTKTLILTFVLTALLVLTGGRHVAAQATEQAPADKAAPKAAAEEKEDATDKDADKEDTEEATASDEAPTDEDAAEDDDKDGEQDDEDAGKKEDKAEEKKPEEKKKVDPRAKRIAEMEAEIKELKAKSALEKARQDAELSAMKLEVERLTAEKSLESARRKKATATFGLEAELLAAENALLKQKRERIKQQNEIASFELAAKLAETKQNIAVAENRANIKSRVLSELDYKSNPFQGGTLHISDRRISLNGAITAATAVYVTERLHFFNNQSEDPIFIVIDSSPGGSVMAGYRIMKAMEASEAPVHVVVKSFAASMAAIITTLAEESYAYPNAIILHHQMSSSTFGNMTMQAEQLEMSKEWARRIMVPLAAKVGTTPEQFVKDMYANNSTGDWEEFADRAKELKWVGNVVSRIREESVTKKPADAAPGGMRIIIGSALAPVSFDGSEETDERGARFKRLPRLQPFDCYFVHNPDGYYRY